jgi:anti-anti-sigma regulatory factor
MKSQSTLIRVDGRSAAHSLAEARSALPEDSGAEVVLDMSSVKRVDPAAVNALTELADEAGQRELDVTLRGVVVDVYRVLKLTGLAARFRFLH